MKKRVLLATGAVIMSALLSGCSMFQKQNYNAMGDYNFEEMQLIQLEAPKEGQDVVVIETNMGTMTAVLYNEYAPKTIENFKARINDGFYNDKPFFAVEQGIYAITGASNEEGTEGVTEDGKFIENECSVNLWPFKGALLGYSGQMGYSDSRFFLCGALEITEENIKELKGYTNQQTGEQVIPDELITAFSERGSVPGFGGSYTIFGQLINGFETLDKILWTASDAQSKKPKEEIKIIKVTLDSYSEDKYPVQPPTADKVLSAEDAAKAAGTSSDESAESSEASE